MTATILSLKKNWQKKLKYTELNNATVWAEINVPLEKPLIPRNNTRLHSTSLYSLFKNHGTSCIKFITQWDDKMVLSYQENKLASCNLVHENIPLWRKLYETDKHLVNLYT